MKKSQMPVILRVKNKPIRAMKLKKRSKGRAKRTTNNFFRRYRTIKAKLKSVKEKQIFIGRSLSKGRTYYKYKPVKPCPKTCP